MSNTSGFERMATMTPPVSGWSVFPRQALAGVRTRRIIALLLDFILVSLVSFALWFALLILTVGLSLVLLPPLFPFVAFFYNGLTVSGWRMATPGMKAMDLEMRLMNGERVPFIYAALHALLFYVSWMFPVVFIVSLLTSDKRCLHDMFAGVIVTRRSI